jgi:hypothetical protein
MFFVLMNSLNPGAWRLVPILSPQNLKWIRNRGLLKKLPVKLLGRGKGQPDQARYVMKKCDGIFANGDSKGDLPIPELACLWIFLVTQGFQLFQPMGWKADCPEKNIKGGLHDFLIN